MPSIEILYATSDRWGAEAPLAARCVMSTTALVRSTDEDGLAYVVGQIDVRRMGFTLASTLGVSPVSVVEQVDHDSGQFLDRLQSRDPMAWQRDVLLIDRIRMELPYRRSQLVEHLLARVLVTHSDTCRYALLLPQPPERTGHGVDGFRDRQNERFARLGFASLADNVLVADLHAAAAVSELAQVVAPVAS